MMGIGDIIFCNLPSNMTTFNEGTRWYNQTMSATVSIPTVSDMGYTSVPPSYGILHGEHEVFNPVDILPREAGASSQLPFGCRHTKRSGQAMVFSEGLQMVGENQWKAHRILDVGKTGGYLGTPLGLGWCLLWPAHGDSDLVATAAPRKPRGFVKASTPRWWESSRPEDSKANMVI